MIARGLAAMAAALLVFVSSGASGYPGGTPDFQTDVAPFCAACHSSVNVESLEGAGARAEKELSANKHLALILQGQRPYDKLAVDERATLARQIQAVEANSKIEFVDFPSQVKGGESFSISVLVTGGAGPVVAVALVDRAHRWYARPASSAGWGVIGAPTVIGPDGKPQSEWLERRPQQMGRNVTFVNVTGVHSDAAAGQWSHSKIIYTLRAPERPGNYPIVGAYFYGTEKATALGSSEHPVYGKQPLGGYGGKSGRIQFTQPLVITVK
ncbi:MAG: hypothetical protein VCC20_08325 [Myxococcota bacterium]